MHCTMMKKSKLVLHKRIGLHFTLVTTWAKDPHFVDTEFFWRMDSGLLMIYYEGKLLSGIGF